MAMPDIDAMLAEAESLASAVAAEVGVGTPAEAAQPATAVETEEAKGKEAMVTEETTGTTPELVIEAMDQFADQQAADVVEPSAVSEDASVTPSAPPEDAAVYAAEATAPEVAEPTPEMQAPSEDTGIPADSGEAMAESAADASAESAAPEVSEQAESITADAFAPAASDASAETPAEETVEPKPAGPSIAKRLLLAPLKTVSFVLGILDAPFAWISPGMKNIIGYIGLVTACMAALAWFLSWKHAPG